MILYKLTTEQANLLFGNWFMPDCFFNPIEVDEKTYFITSVEVDNCVNNNFLWVKNLPILE